MNVVSYFQDLWSPANPALSDFSLGLSLEHVVSASVLWFFGLFLIKFSLPLILKPLCGHMPWEKCFLPQTMPVVDKPGKTEDWTLSLKDATDKQVGKFLKFRGLKPDAGREVAGQEALKYKNELWDKKSAHYLDETFSKGNRGVAYPVAQTNWNGWAGWYAELGDMIEKGWTGNAAYAVQHATSGALACYVLYVDASPYAYKCAMYLDMGFNMVDLILMILSLLLRWNVTAYSGPRKDMMGCDGIFKMLVLHHFGAVLMEGMALYFGAEYDFSCEVMIALLGVTGLLHFHSTLMDSTPIRTLPALYLAQCAFIFGTMIWYRGVYWLYIVFKGLAAAWENSYTATIGGSMAFMIFSLFNLDFVRHYFKLTQKALNVWKYGPGYKAVKVKKTE